ncbi:pentapeptide repeat-containing protein [Polaribacter sp.]|uniref:pentapeptide repeat-containing protein n=1 Tax=Polaribacter sp. TaxID=1920175 RepID=UPI003EF51578
MKNTLITLSFFIVSTITFSQKNIDASTILKAIKNGKPISYQNVTVVGTLDFTFMEEAMKKLPSKKKKSWWGNNSNYDNTVEKLITANISFVNCTFKDDVLAYIPDDTSGYTFTASFKNSSVFKDCIFEQKAMFKYSDFNSDADFSGSTFKGDSTFKYAKFNKNINFTNTIFYEVATFKYAKFSSLGRFSNSLFKDSAIFKYTNFNNGVSFKNSSFEEDLNIKYMKVSGSFDITNIKVAYEIDAKYTSINGKSFNKNLISENN